jgi:site-specific DNA-methyltransferase (adenine-specific)
MKNMINQVICGDAIEKLGALPDKSVNLVCIDPPYNIAKDEWDKLGIVKKGYGGNTENNYGDEYFEWMADVFEEIERVLKDNGSFFFFHNDFRMTAELDRRIQERTSFILKNLIVWNKRFEGSPKKGFLDGYVVKTGLTSFNKMCEYIMFYTFNNSWKLKEARKRLGVKQTTISREVLSKKGNMTGWYSNIETGKNYVTTETIKPITKHLGLTYDDIVPKFRNQKTHHSVWNYDLDSKKRGHVTPKPVALLENIIKHTTDEGDVVLDCFAGTSSLAIACINLNRDYIMIEKSEKYCQISCERIAEQTNVQNFTVPGNLKRSANG